MRERRSRIGSALENIEVICSGIVNPITNGKLEELMRETRISSQHVRKLVVTFSSLRINSM